MPRISPLILTFPLIAILGTGLELHGQDMTWVLQAGLLATDGDQATASTPIIHICDQPFMFGFGSWEKAKTAFPVKADGIHINARNCQGGAGMAGLSVPIAGHGDWTPALTLAVTEQNQAATLSLHLADADGTSHVYSFDLSKLRPGSARTILADHGASLDEPLKVDKPGSVPGLGQISSLMVIGDWGQRPIDVVLTKVTLTPPSDEIRAQRMRLKELKAKEAEQERKEVAAREKIGQDLLKMGARHPEDGPVARYVGAVGTDIIAITLQAGQHVNNQLIAYVAEPGDEIVEEDRDKPWHEVKDGKVVDCYKKAVVRNNGNKPNKVGLLSPDGTQIFITGKTKGQMLDETVVDVPAAYAIQSNDDATYAQPLAPVKVFRKGKPNGFSQPLPFLYTISLGLPTPLKEGATYTIRFVGVNTSKEIITYTHKPREIRSLAVHAIQTGYRPDDPYKHAYLSFWMGTDKDGISGSCTPENDTFEVVDMAGRTVFTGKTELAKKVGDEEQISIHEKVDYTKATVRRLDFSALATPGEYRVYIPGIGLSGPFRIAADVWEKPFKAAMQGILAQRQGIDLGPPACAYTRKRPFHPDDGVQFYQMTIPEQAGQEGTRGDNLIELAKTGRLERVTGVWGGYQDAGDWDSLGGHLSATYDLLGLYDLNPKAFSRIKLSLPAEEMHNDLPDILDEAMWQMPLWRRLQLPDGGVRGGYGYGWGCPDGLTSTMIKSAGVYAVDPHTTLHFAAAAARTARVLGVFDKTHAGEYLESAIRAWDWAGVHVDKDQVKSLRNKRAMAAVELLAVTRDGKYDEAFKQSSELCEKKTLYLDQLDTDFAYARLPDGLGDPALKTVAVERITAYADHAIAFSRKNAFELIAGARTDYPVIFACRHFSTPAQGGFALIYAYELTRKPSYLSAAVQGSNYCLGANPDNLSYCTGIGYNAQHFNFIIDAQITGQLPDVMVGHIPYGQGNEGNAMSKGMNGWVQQWLLNFGPAKKMTPNWFDWPVNEQYIDFARYPLHNENCFNATTVPAACYWFYLATRPESHP